MQVVVNHLTRMQKGCICVAGIDVETGLPVRPVLDRQMPTDMLARHGGPFEMARRVELGETRFVGRVPEIEDQRFDAAACRPKNDVPADEFWSLLECSAHEKLRDIFGPELERVGETCAVAATHGLRSLGCYWAEAGRLFLDSSRAESGSSIEGRTELQTQTDQFESSNSLRDIPRIRFAWYSGGHRFNVPVTDIRLYGADHVTPCADTVRRVAEEITTAPRVLVSVGLSRPYRKSPDAPPRHWLQINNFHLRHRPDWKLTG